MTRALLMTVAVLGLMLAGAGARIMVLERALAAKPKIEVRTVEKIKTVKVAGPVKVVEKITYLPGNGRVVERTIERDEVKTEIGRDVVADRKEEAACPPAPRSKRWTAAFQFGPRGGTVPIGGRAGVTLFNVIDLTGGYRKDGQDRLFLDAGFRF